METPTVPRAWPTNELYAAVLCADLSLGLYEHVRPADTRLRPVLDLVGPMLTMTGVPTTARKTLVTALETATHCAATAENDIAVVATDAVIALVRAALAVHDHQPYGRNRMRPIGVVLDALADLLHTSEDDVTALRHAAATMQQAVHEAIAADVVALFARERVGRDGGQHLLRSLLTILAIFLGRHGDKRKADKSTISSHAGGACYGVALAVALAIDEAPSAAACRALVLALRARAPWILADPPSSEQGSACR